MKDIGFNFTYVIIILITYSVILNSIFMRITNILPVNLSRAGKLEKIPPEDIPFTSIAFSLLFNHLVGINLCWL